jgi:fatty-acyl-CoA synthase
MDRRVPEHRRPDQGQRSSGAGGVSRARWREFLYSHPAIEDVQVIGVPDAKYGEELCAWIKIRPGQDLTADQVLAYCQGKIAHYKIPRYVRFTDEFPMTVTGKIQKFKMRERSITELGLQAANQVRTA